MLAVAAVVFLAGGILTAKDAIRSVSALEGGLPRKSYGGGSHTEELQVSVEGGEKEDLPVEISERKYSHAKVQELFRRCTKKLDRLILGKNSGLDRVESDLDLVREIPAQPVEVSWELDRYDVMDIYGKLKAEELVPEGTMIQLKAVLTYTGNREEQAVYTCTAMVYPRTGSRKEKQIEQVREAIRREDERSKTEAVLRLPEEVEGKSIRYYPKMEERGIVLMVMSVLIGILLYALEQQNTIQESRKRKQQMLRDYPEIINKLTLFLGAGMTVKRAWKKVVQDYEEQKDIRGSRDAYEEMKKTCREMESGITEAESYERFGRQCHLQEYVRLGALLSQNLRRGTKGLNQMLHLEAVQALEERKARARKMGEEAGTKLLGPMFLMLAVVLVIVVIPAFFSIQL